MNRQLGGKQGSETSDPSPLSLLVHAADAQHQRPPIKGAQAESRKAEEEQAAQRQAVARAEALQQQGFLNQLRGAGIGEADIIQQNAAIMAAQQQQQAAALALASDIRSAVAAAQLRQAAQLQNQDLLLARAAAMQQQLGGIGGVDIQQELELQRLEELERRQLLAAAAAGAPMGALAARQQLELQEAHLRQEQIDRQLQQAAAGDSILDRAGMRPPAPDPSAPTCRVVPSSDQATKDTFQKTPGSVVVPCRARGMPMDHNFKTAYFVIPENVEHGEELICSYFACRNAGIKFRYCTHCKVPVAKRNFRKRHKHGKTTSANEAEDDQSNSGGEEDPATTSKTKVKDAEPVGAPSEPKVKKEVFSQELNRKRSEEKTPKPPVPQAPERAAPEPVVVKSRKETKVVSDDSDTSQSNGRPKISVEREKLWAGLLGKRPPTTDGEAVSAWLMEVLSVSDLDTPLKENGSSGVLSAVSSNKSPDAAAQAAAASKEWSGNAGAKRGAQSILIKKKRPLPLLSKDEDASKEDASSNKNDVGSFAEWKDRKKHKGPKKGYVTSA